MSARLATQRPTPAARAYVGSLALHGNGTVDEALQLAGYRIDTASPVFFYGSRCYRRAPGVRLVVRNGKPVRVSLNDWVLEGWLLRLSKKLSFFGLRAGMAS